MRQVIQPFRGLADLYLSLTPRFLCPYIYIYIVRLSRALFNRLCRPITWRLSTGEILVCDVFGGGSAATDNWENRQVDAFSDYVRDSGDWTMSCVTRRI